MTSHLIAVVSSTLLLECPSYLPPNGLDLGDKKSTYEQRWYRNRMECVRWQGQHGVEGHCNWLGLRVLGRLPVRSAAV